MKARSYAEYFERIMVRNKKNSTVRKLITGVIYEASNVTSLIVLGEHGLLLLASNE